MSLHFNLQLCCDYVDPSQQQQRTEDFNDLSGVSFGVVRGLSRVCQRCLRVRQGCVRGVCENSVRGQSGMRLRGVFRGQSVADSQVSVEGCVRGLSGVCQGSAGVARGQQGCGHVFMGMVRGPSGVSCGLCQGPVRGQSGASQGGPSGF